MPAIAIGLCGVGAPALGPHATNFTVWGTSIFTQDPREALMPWTYSAGTAWTRTWRH